MTSSLLSLDGIRAWDHILLFSLQIKKILKNSTEEEELMMDMLHIAPFSPSEPFNSREYRSLVNMLIFRLCRYY
jgi:hypothetical protein